MNTNGDKTLFLVDGSGFIFRAYHALPPFSRGDGTPVGAVLGFSNMLFRLLEKETIHHLAVIFDTARRNFRHDLYPDYKANRSEPPEDLVPQFALVREACRALSVPFLEQNGFEADDLIATLTVKAREQGFLTTIVSSDKDLMQLVDEKTSLYDPMKNRRIGAEEVLEKFGVAPSRVIDVQALAGDSSDNIPGVPGIGLKTAATLIQEYGDLETLLKRAGEIKQPKRRQNLIDFADEARLSRELVTLKKDVPLENPHVLDSFQRRPLSAEQIFPFLDENQFKTLRSRVLKLGLTPPMPSPEVTSPESSEDQGSRPEEVTNESKTLQPASTPKQAVLPKASDALLPGLSCASKAYTLIQDQQTLAQWVEALKGAGVFAFDTETTSLDPRKAELVGLSLSYAPGVACYLPLSHKKSPEEATLFGPSEASRLPDQLSIEEVLEALRPLFEEPGFRKIAHNAKYDLTVLRRYGLVCRGLDDTMVMSYVLDGTRHGHGLDELAEKHFSYSTIPFQEVAGQGKEQVSFDFVPLDQALSYAAEDADITLRLYHFFRARLAEEKAVTVYETLDRPLLPVLLEMEHHGVKIDTSQLAALSVSFKDAMTGLEQDIQTLAGSVFNVGSSQQLAKVLFEDLKLPSGKKGKSGTYSTSADVLENLALDGHDIAEKVILWRQYAKLKSTYTDALVREMNQETQRVHTSFGMTVTSTGRLSSRHPNLQNIPIRTEEGRKIREAFVAEKGHLLVSLDYSQIELRLLAHMAGIETLKEAFHQGRDIHAQTASEVFNIPLEAVDSEHRRRAKAINFGIIYGISAFGLARQLKISRTEAQQYITAYCEKFPGILSYMDVLKEAARQQGYVETLLGRKCFINQINSKNPALRGFAERQAINAPLQGTASDIIKKAMIQVGDRLKEANLFPKLILQVHDELVFESQEQDAQAVADLSKQVMESIVNLSVPLRVDYGMALSWDQAH